MLADYVRAFDAHDVPALAKLLHDDVEMSMHGYIAMALGIGFTLVVGIGLMALVFYSSRKGYDDEVGQFVPHDENER